MLGEYSTTELFPSTNRLHEGLSSVILLSLSFKMAPNSLAWREATSACLKVYDGWLTFILSPVYPCCIPQWDVQGLLSTSCLQASFLS